MAGPRRRDRRLRQAWDARHPNPDAEQFAERLARAIRRRLRRHLRDRVLPDPGDLLVDIWLAHRTGRKTYRRVRTEQTWFMTWWWNLAWQAVRVRYVGPGRGRRPPGPLPADVLASPPVDGWDDAVRAWAGANLDVERLIRSARLSRGQRIAFTGRFREGRPATDVAEEFGTTRGNVSTAAQVAIRKIRPQARKIPAILRLARQWGLAPVEAVPEWRMSWWAKTKAARRRAKMRPKRLASRPYYTPCSPDPE